MKEKKITVVIASDCMGRGDEELGRTLMKSYIYSLTEADVKPACIIFINKGVSLTTSGSTVLDMLRQLEEDGVELLSCGACLDFYSLADELQVGEITNMYSNVEIMHDSDSTVFIS